MAKSDEQGERKPSDVQRFGVVFERHMPPYFSGDRAGFQLQDARILTSRGPKGEPKMARWDSEHVKVDGRGEPVLGEDGLPIRIGPGAVKVEGVVEQSKIVRK